MLWVGEGVARVNLSVSDQGVQGQRVAFVQLFGGGPPPYSTHGERGVPASHWLWVRLGQMRLWSAPPLRLENDPRAPRVQRPDAAAPAPRRGGEAKGVVREPEKPEPQPASPAQGWAARS